MFRKHPGIAAAIELKGVVTNAEGVPAVDVAHCRHCSFLQLHCAALHAEGLGKADDAMIEKHWPQHTKRVTEFQLEFGLGPSMVGLDDRAHDDSRRAKGGRISD